MLLWHSCKRTRPGGEETGLWYIKTLWPWNLYLLVANIIKHELNFLQKKTRVLMELHLTHDLLFCLQVDKVDGEKVRQRLQSAPEHTTGKCIFNKFRLTSKLELLSPVKTRGYRVELVRLSVCPSVCPSVCLSRLMWGTLCTRVECEGVELELSNFLHV